MSFKARPIEERFWTKVDRRGPDECWPWTGKRNWKGYGRLSVGYGFRPATQISWEIANDEPFPLGLVCRHACDNPPCVNPAHLMPGTHRENCMDRWSGRSPNVCLRGHQWTPENTYVSPKGVRQCRECKRETQRAAYLASKA